MTLRIARHTNNLKSISDFYTQILGLTVLGKFENHDNYNGVFLGKEGLNWHLEYTTSTEKIQHRFDEDNILIFYPNIKSEYDAIMIQVEKNSLLKIKAKNPYWNKNGIMIKDPDGYNIVISDLKVC